MKALRFFSVVLLVSGVLFVFSQALPLYDTGSINGTVLPADASATVEAVLDGETVASAEADSRSGNFSIDGLPAGSYEVVITPASGEYSSQSVSNVQVQPGEETDLGEIYLDID